VNNAILVERIAAELFQVQGAVAQAQRLLTKISQVEDEDIREAIVAVIALMMQSFYTGAERISYEIAKVIDQDVPTGNDWRRQLLEQMCVAIPTVRPAVISESTLVNLNELRRFRHVVRSNYSYNLRAERVVKLMETLVDCEQSLTQDIQNFIAIA
jgi:hypothetical protein